MSQKLKRASQFTFGELNLRQYFFDKWRRYKNVSIASDTIDVALLVWGLRDAMNEWKSLAWPRRFKSRRNLRVIKSFFGQSSSFMGDESDEVSKKNEYVWPQQERFGVLTSNLTQQAIPEDETPDYNQVYTQEMWQAGAFQDGLQADDNKSATSLRSLNTFSSLRSGK